MKLGWENVRLGDILTFNYGKALPKSERTPNGTVPVFGANGIKDYSNKSLSEGPALIIGRKGSVGEINRVDGPFWPLDVAYFTSHDFYRLDFGYMGYLLRSLDLPSMAKGVKPGINRNEVYELSTNLPPLKEQQRIVEKLDALFAETNRLQQQYTTQLTDLEDLRQSLLQKAFVGELT